MSKCKFCEDTVEKYGKLINKWIDTKIEIREEIDNIRRRFIERGESRYSINQICVLRTKFNKLIRREYNISIYQEIRKKIDLIIKLEKERGGD